jgi:hypothetical protein
MIDDLSGANAIIPFKKRYSYNDSRDVKFAIKFNGKVLRCSTPKNGIGTHA